MSVPSGFHPSSLLVVLKIVSRCTTTSKRVGGMSERDGNWTMQQPPQTDREREPQKKKKKKKKKEQSRGEIVVVKEELMALCSP
jgi:hypothetical protein